MRRWLLLLFSSVAPMLAAPAGAHAFLDHASPAVGSTVHTAPTQVKLWFTEELEAAFSTVQVSKAGGERIDKDDVRLDPADATLLSVSLPPLAPGLYRVKWRVLSVDTHATEGDFTFDVAP